MEWVRKATGSAIALIDPRGRVLVLRRAYPPYDWVLPGGAAEAGESPVATARRELNEETGLEVEPEQLTGIYYQPDHAAGEFIHFVFRAQVPAGLALRLGQGEIAEGSFFDPERLPQPMSVSTRRRLLEALAPDGPALPVTLPPRSEG